MSDTISEEKPMLRIEIVCPECDEVMDFIPAMWATPPEAGDCVHERNVWRCNDCGHYVTHVNRASEE